MSSSLKRFACVLGLSLISTAAFAAPPSPMPWLKSSVEKGRKLAERKVTPDSPQEVAWRKDVKVMVDDILAWDMLTEKTLGRHWAERTPKEREEFSKLLREMIEASYESKMQLAARGKVDNKPNEVAIDWTGEKVGTSTASATAKVKSGKTKADLTFNLTWDGKKWRVYDLVIDGASTINTYRSQFGKIVSKSGFPALLERMRKKVAELRSGKGELAP